MHGIAIFLMIYALWALALARLTRLLTADEITDFIRVWAYKRAHGGENKLTYFVQCPWCMGMWLSFATVWSVFLVSDLWSWWLYPVLALSGSYLVGLMASNLEPDDDTEIEISE